MSSLPVIWFSLFATFQDVKDYSNPDQGVQIVVPAKGYTIREKDLEFGFPGTVCEIENTDLGVQGVVRVLPREWMTPNGYADTREEALGKTAGVKKLTRTGESTPTRTFGSWIQRDWLLELANDRLRYVFLAATRGSRVAEFLLWVDDRQWEGAKEELYRIVNSAVFQSVWHCGNCTRRVKRNEADCAACGTPVYPPAPDLAEFSKKNDIQLITMPSAEYVNMVYPPDYGIQVQRATEKVLARFFLTLARELTLYPDGFFRGVDVECMIVAEDLGKHGLLGLATYFQATILYRTREELVVQEQDRETVHHEILHFIDTRDDGTCREDPEWEKLNPWGFEYDREKYKGEFWSYRRDLKGFVSQYSMSNIADDKAEIFGWLVTRPHDVLERAKKDKWIAKKVEYVKKMAFKVSPQLDEKWWETLLESK